MFRDIKKLNDIPEPIRKMSRNFRKHACNNYRKLHGLPMRRWKYMHFGE